MELQQEQALLRHFALAAQFQSLLVSFVAEYQ
jgi:hypothetical protein